MNNSELTEMSITASYYSKEKKYWLEKLAGEPAICNIPYDMSKKMIQEGGFNNTYIEISDKVCLKLDKLCGNSKLKLYMVLTTVLYIVLEKYTGINDILLGTPVFKNDNIEGQGINSILVLRNQISENLSFKELLLQVRQSILDAIENQSYPYELLKFHFNEENTSKTNNEFFDVFLMMEDLQDSNVLNNYNPNVAISIKNSNSRVGISLRYNASCYFIETMEKFFERYKRVLESVLDNYEISISDIDMLSPYEREKILSDFNCYTTYVPENKTVHELFDEQAALFPDNTAVVLGESMYTYKELCELSNKVANFLINEVHIGNGDYVGILIQRSINAIAAMLGIMKAGAAYIPLDHSNPEQRLKHIISDANIKVVLSEKKHILTLDRLQYECSSFVTYLCMDTDDIYSIEEQEKNKLMDKQLWNYVAQSGTNAIEAEGWYNSYTGEPFSNGCFTQPIKTKYQYDLGILGKYTSEKPNIKVEPGDVAYAIYTSGTTGAPKGVMVEHRNVINLVSGLKKRIYSKYNSFLNVSLVASFCFDASIQQIFGALLQGHTLFIVPDDVKKDGESILQFCKDKGIEILDGTPTHLKLMIHGLEKLNGTVKLKHLIVGGEELQKTIVEDFISSFGEKCPVITNVYGPTECCVDSVSFDITKDTIKTLNIIPIGKPLPNQKVYILNNNNLQAIGIAGELCIGGKGVARGYLKKDDLTSQRFIKDPFSKDCIIYRTGDLARWLPDGSIEFLGRMDRQVKIKGYRIEVGEVEHCLMKNSGVKDAVVLLGEDNNANAILVAYVVIENENTVNELREYLLQFLPEYMVPTYFIKVDKIHMNASGKVDKKALDMYGTKLKMGHDHMLPKNKLEQVIYDIWRQFIGFESASINDNFFALGGDSLKGMMVVNRYRELLCEVVNISMIFEATTIEKHSEYIIKFYPEKANKIIKGDIEEYCGDSSNSQTFIDDLNEFTEDEIAAAIDEIFKERGM